MEYLRDGNRYFIRLVKEEKVFEALENFAQETGVRAGHLSGIGALKDVELGFYHLQEKKYDRRLFTEEAELLSLEGNLSSLEGNPFFHIHTILGAADFSTYGGHMFAAKVAVTVEINFRVFGPEISRLPDEDVGLNLLSLCKVSH